MAHAVECTGLYPANATQVRTSRGSTVMSNHLPFETRSLFKCAREGRRGLAPWSRLRPGRMSHGTICSRCQQHRLEKADSRLGVEL
eukprot:354125-Chlamydomonas_euryale.AAC.2